MVQFALKHVIVKEKHFQAPLPLPVDKVERSKQKLYLPMTFNPHLIYSRVNKARAKLEEYERGSATCSISPNTLISLVFPFLLVSAMDTRILFENSRLNAIEAICTGQYNFPPCLMIIVIQSRTLHTMSSTLRDQCLGIIYQGLVQSGFDLPLACLRAIREHKISSRNHLVLSFILFSFHPRIFTLNRAIPRG